MDCSLISHLATAHRFQLMFGQIDTTSDFLKWCASQDFSLIDLNMHPVVMKDEVCFWTFHLFVALTQCFRISHRQKHVAGQPKTLLLTLGIILPSKLFYRVLWTAIY